MRKDFIRVFVILVSKMSSSYTASCRVGCAWRTVDMTGTGSGMGREGGQGGEKDGEDAVAVDIVTEINPVRSSVQFVFSDRIVDPA